VVIIDSFLVSQWSEVLRNVQNLLHVLEHMMQSSLFSLMRVLWIAGQPIVDMHGQYVVEKRHAKPFSAVDDGKYCLFTDSFSSNFYDHRFSVLPGLSLNDGIIHCDIVEGAFDSQLFYTFIGRLLDQMEPFPAPKSVIVMDNCRIHKHPEILELIESQ
jgi:hypothetical protein